jgi:hypothetical protein
MVSTLFSFSTLLVIAFSVFLFYTLDQKSFLQYFSKNFNEKNGMKDFHQCDSHHSFLSKLMNSFSVEDHNLSVSVHWMAPFFSGGGYCSEAISFVSALFWKFVYKILFLNENNHPHFI